MSGYDTAALQEATAGIIATACADPNDGIAWAAERSTQMTTAARIVDELFDPEITEAEKRGAEKATAETIMGGQRYAVVWALREAAAAWRANGLAYGDDDEETNLDILVARKLNDRADRIERGEQA